VDFLIKDLAKILRYKLYVTTKRFNLPLNQGAIMSAPGNITLDPILATANQYQQPLTIPNAQRVPTSLDVLPANSVWVYTGTSPYTLYVTSGQGNWQAFGGTTGAFTALTVTGLTTLAALTQVGTASINASGAGVTTIGTGGTGAVNIGNATGNTSVTGSLGTTTSITAGTTLTATLGAITATNGNFVKGTAGNKDVYTSVGTTTAAGANSAGTVTLVAGTATVATTAVTANSLIRLYRQGVGATGAAALGIVTRGTITAGTSFVINSVQAADATALQASDVSVIFWEIVN
jgi:hypothetical protein